MADRAAVVIGVDKTGGLPKLNSASLGACAVADWLQSEGYDVKCLTDQTEAVHSHDIEDAVAGFVTEPPRYRLLVVYFSGHGYWHARNDLWLLSGAPAKTSDAVNLSGAMDLARYSGINNVVFISDACRSIPDSQVGAKVSGVDVFPNFANVNDISKIDVFNATSEARSAYEGEIEGQSHSILTYALMSAFEQPKPDMVRQITVNGTKEYIVPNRQLEDYLQEKVNDILAGIDINLTQRIEANVPSSDDIYIARAQTPIPSMPSAPRASVTAVATPMFEAAEVIERTLSSSPDLVSALNAPLTGRADTLSTTSADTEEKLKPLLPNPDVDHMESTVGITVVGARVANVVTTKGKDNANVELLDPGDNGLAVIRLWDVNPAVSVAIELEDRRCAVIAGLDGYIAHASFEEHGLANVSYVPSANHWRWDIYENKKDDIDRLRALVALAVDNNTFRVRSGDQANKLADQIRMDKSIDPTLGLYAAHAYSQVSDDNNVRSVMDYMHSDLQADLFDVWVLSSRRPQRDLFDFPLAPFCPMLTQTWSLLRPREISLPPVLQESIPYLCNSLWTTFQPEVCAPIMQAIATGELQ